MADRRRLAAAPNQRNTASHDPSQRSPRAQGSDSDSVNLGSNPGPPAKLLSDITAYFEFPRSPELSRGLRSSGAGGLHLIVDSTGWKLPVNHRRVSDLGIKIRPPLLKDQRNQDGPNRTGLRSGLTSWRSQPCIHSRPHRSRR